MGTIVLDLRPGSGIGPFSLGMPICESFAQIEQQPNIYDVVHVKYLDEDPLKLDIVISFPNHGFHLCFDPHSQRLRLIEIFDVNHLQMRYATSLIGGPSTLATFVAFYALFGPTGTGMYDKEKGVYFLIYTGLSFAFPIPTQYSDCIPDGEAELPLEFPDSSSTTTVTSRVSIYDSSTDSKVGIGSKMGKAIAPPLPVGSFIHGRGSFQAVDFSLQLHLTVALPDWVQNLYLELSFQYKATENSILGEEMWFTVGGQHIPFGASPQGKDVLTDLGRPCEIHLKQVDQMVIHSASDPRPRIPLCSDYFYNYFTRGLDILFDGQTHKVKKFVLHTNYPGHANFNSYMRCNFFIYNSGNGNSFHEGSPSKQCITTSTKWDQVKEILGECGRAAIHKQGSTNNPFGSTFLYAYQNVAFEVMKNNYIIATVTLFQS
ncbi:unnamed protein product [Rhodiola kirilowii]